MIERLPLLGVSAICNMLAAIKTAKHYNLSANDVILAPATGKHYLHSSISPLEFELAAFADGADLYKSEHARILKEFFPAVFSAKAAAEVYERCLLGESIAHYEELTEVGRKRIFNLGYFTWVEQQGVALEAFEARRSQQWWRQMRTNFANWDDAIRAFNTA